MSISRAFIASVARDIRDQQNDPYSIVMLRHNNEIYCDGIEYECEKCNTGLIASAKSEPIQRSVSICPQCGNKRMLSSIYLYEN